MQRGKYLVPVLIEGHLHIECSKISMTSFAKAGFLDEESNLAKVEKPFLVDAISTIGGAICGLRTVTTYIESAFGLVVGGKTGFTPLITGLCFIVAIFFTPFMLLDTFISNSSISYNYRNSIFRWFSLC